MNIKEKLRVQSSFIPPGAPFMLEIQGFIYKYAKYLIGTDNFKYVCKYGYDRHKNKCSTRCPVYFYASFIIIKNDQDIEEVQLGEISIQNDNHTCQKGKRSTTNYIVDLEHKNRIEKIYLSQTPRPTQLEILTQLSKQIDCIPVSERIVYNT